MTDLYKHNPLIHKDRRLGNAPSEWVRSFACEDLKPLIVCRGPIRKEAMDVFTEMGITHFGILLSEKDSIVYANALAPELRQLTDSNRVHRVPAEVGDRRGVAAVPGRLQPVGDRRQLLRLPHALGGDGGLGRGERGEEQGRDEDGGTTAHAVVRRRKGPWIRQQSPSRGNPRGVDGPLSWPSRGARAAPGRP